jgi:hypothetical protein
LSRFSAYINNCKQVGYRGKSDEIWTFLASRCSHPDPDRRFSNFPLIDRNSPQMPFNSAEGTLHEIDSDASGFGPRASRRVDSRAGTGCRLPERCSGRRGGGALCRSPRCVGGLVQAVSSGATRQTSTRVNAPSRIGHLAAAVSPATPARLPPLASAKAAVVPKEFYATLGSRPGAFSRGDHGGNATYSEGEAEMDLGLVDGIIGILLAAYFAVRSSAASLRTTARRVKNGNAATVR